MTDTIIEPLDEIKLWRSRQVRYWAGTWDAVSPVVPRFELSDLRASADEPANPYMKTVVRVPRSQFEQRIPVGVVSNTYTLAQHHDVAAKCFEGIRLAGVDPTPLRCEVGLTELGEWMNLRIYFPEQFDYRHAEDDRLALKVECYNSVDGSSRLILLLGWFRFVCTNGLVIGETKTVLRDIHNQNLDLSRISEAIVEGFEKVQNDLSRMDEWNTTEVRPDCLARWVDKDVATAWGKKAACRVFHICRSGHDVELEDPFAPGAPTNKPVRELERVPGAPGTAVNVFDVSQALSWVATGRNNPDERLDWQTRIPDLLASLTNVLQAS